MGEEEERRELSDGLKEGELLSPCSTDKELGLSSRACTKVKGEKPMLAHVFQTQINGTMCKMKKICLHLVVRLQSSCSLYTPLLHY